jgi:Enoyl-CoA hydratase/isomerase
MLEAESQLSISRGQVCAALDRAFACNNVESIIAELETFAAPEFVRVEDQSRVQKWARMTLDALAQRSPTSLKITLEAVRIAEREDYTLSDYCRDLYAHPLPLSSLCALNYSLECFSFILKSQGLLQISILG